MSEYERREEEEAQVGVDERTAQMWRERGIKGGKEGWISKSSKLTFKDQGPGNTGGV